MAVKVVKKDGSREDFKRKKIEKACKGSGASSKDAKRIAEEIEREAYDGIRTSEIRNMVLERLRRVDSRLASSWMEFESKKKKR